MTRSSAKSSPGGGGLFDFISIAAANGNIKYDIPEQYQHLLPSHFQGTSQNPAGAQKQEPLFIHSSAKGTYVEKGKKAAARIEKATKISEKANQLALAAGKHAAKMEVKRGKGGLDIDIALPVGGSGGMEVQVGRRVVEVEDAEPVVKKGKKVESKKRKLEVTEEDEEEQEEREEKEKEEDEEYVPDGKAAKKRRTAKGAKASKTAKATPKMQQKTARSAAAKRASPKKGGKKKELTPELEPDAEAGAEASKKVDAEAPEEEETVKLEVAVVATVEGSNDDGQKDKDEGDAKPAKEEGDDKKGQEEMEEDEDYEQQDRNPDAEPE